MATSRESRRRCESDETFFERASFVPFLIVFPQITERFLDESVRRGCKGEIMAKAKGFKPADLKKYYFWIVLPLIVVVAIVFTFMVKGKIKKAYVEKSEAITTAKKDVDEVASNSKHPNDDTISAIKKETGILADNVYNAWTLMYDDQKMRNRWPRQLSREFLDLVENKLNFRDPIGVGKPYLLEDYGFFIANHLPDLLVEMNRRRCQVKHYKLLKKNEMSLLGIQGLEERFWPVYVAKDADGNNITYVAIYSDLENEKSPIRDVLLYDVKKDLVSQIDDSQLRDELKAVTDPEPYYLDVDPYILDPKNMIEYGMQDTDLQSIMQAIQSPGVEGGGSAGVSGGGAGPMSAGPGSTGGPGGGSRGSANGMGEVGGSMGGMSFGIAQIPGDGYDPAEEQVAGTSLEELGGGGAVGGMTGMPGMPGATGGGTPGAVGGRSARGGAGGPGGVTGGPRGGMGVGGMGGMEGGTNVEDPSWSQKIYPGLPPYKERRRIVGNVDWPYPEIYSMLTWDSQSSPTSIEVWYAQETLWVYEALIRVIAATNATSAEYTDNIAKAPVKCVEEMLIGQNAAIEFTTLGETIGDLTGKSANTMDMGVTSSDMMASVTGMAGGEASILSGSAENQALTKILIGRYVGDKDDKKDQPLMHDDKPPYAEFNKMPICLKVDIDQTRIPDLLVSCANSTMPIDIRHIRIMPDNNVPFVMPIPLENMTMDAAAGSMMGAMGDMMGGMSGGLSSSGGNDPNGRNSRGAAGDMNGMGGMGGLGGVEIGRSDLSQSEYGPDTIRVEIYGVINIYNKPNKANFATGASAEEADAESANIIANAQGDANSSDENADDENAESGADASDSSAPAPAPAATTPEPAPSQPSTDNTSESGDAT